MSDFAAMAFSESEGEGVFDHVFRWVLGFRSRKIVELLEDELDGIAYLQSAKFSPRINIAGIESQ